MIFQTTVLWGNSTKDDDGFVMSQRQKYHVVKFTGAELSRLQNSGVDPIAWCVEQFGEPMAYNHEPGKKWANYGRRSLYFIDQNDAMLFKLRWI
jgi:hypothetical protein